MKKYSAPQLEVKELGANDIIATSTHVDKGYDSGLAPISPKAE